MKVKSHALVFSDFQTAWYKHWAGQLKQDRDHLSGFALRANKFWQNAVICQILHERGVLKPGSRGLGFGVGNERLPALFAKMGVNITATDQDYREQKATHWSKGELATGLQSLNQLNICNTKEFKERIEYFPADMTKIPSKLYNAYDFVWSNCALGHLGSIEAGLAFIESSLACLTPGGWAVHTTEFNILSDSDTIESGDTVIFRLSDIYKLYDRLISKGYRCQPLHFFLGRSDDDFRISMQPQFGNDFSKIQVGGHLATQVVLVLSKPKRNFALGKNFGTFRLRRSYRKGIQEIAEHVSVNPNIKQILASSAIPPNKLNIRPLRESLKISLKRGTRKEITVEYKNNSRADLYALNGTLLQLRPTVIATTHPNDRISSFSDKSWVGTSKNRPSAKLLSKNAVGRYHSADHISAGQKFAFMMWLNANNQKPGTYTEYFGLVQEGAGWIDNTDVRVVINVS